MYVVHVAIATIQCYIIDLLGKVALGQLPLPVRLAQCCRGVADEDKHSLALRAQPCGWLKLLEHFVEVRHFSLGARQGDAAHWVVTP